MIFFRKSGRDHVADIVDPHNPGLDDAWQKAVGLAEFASKHEEAFGRIETVFVDGGVIRRLDLTNGTVRSKVMSIRSNDALRLLYQQEGKVWP